MGGRGGYAPRPCLRLPPFSGSGDLLLSLFAESPARRRQPAATSGGDRLRVPSL